MTRATVTETTGRRPWAVTLDGEIVELHSTEAAARRKVNRLNGACTNCGLLDGEHAPGCGLGAFDRDPAFGSLMDEEE